jgi:molybdopterin-guanine dinucleotide biosynthesis protein A
MILAGGENRRMPVLKAFVEIEGKPLIARTLEVFRRLFSEVILVTRTPDPYRRFGVRLVEDLLEQRGPLTGIYSGLSAIEAPFGMVVACDMPFLHEGLIRRMLDLAEGCDIVIPRREGRVEPLHALYSKGLLPTMRELLNKGIQTPQALLPAARVRVVEEAEWLRFDPEGKVFINLNTQEDLARVQERAVSGRS